MKAHLGDLEDPDKRANQPTQRALFRAFMAAPARKNEPTSANDALAKSKVEQMTS